jgi:hypothetical protein
VYLQFVNFHHEMPLLCLSHPYLIVSDRHLSCFQRIFASLLDTLCFFVDLFEAQSGFVDQAGLEFSLASEV